MSKFFPVLSPAYFAPATFKALDGAGALKEFEFDCEFKRMRRSEMEAIDAEVNQLRATGKTVDLHVLARVCKGWRVKPPAQEGQPDQGPIHIEFSEDQAKELEEDYPGFIGACVRAFYLSSQPARAAHHAQKN
jgi:hypothetical protein